ncbi:MAG: hypothetical protein KDC98_13240 [Planctomycetes bacterium]|nr:hypothetical protein [Planctomycetota bacterium]
MLAATPRRTPRLPGAILALSASLAVSTGCAVLPPQSYPAYLDSDLEVRCRVPASGRLRVPASGPDLVVRELRAEPPPRGETFDRGGARWLLYDGGTDVVVRTRLRIYGAGDRDPVDTDAGRTLFPDAVEWPGDSAVAPCPGNADRDAVRR